MKFQGLWCTGVRVGIFRISPIKLNACLPHGLLQFRLKTMLVTYNIEGQMDDLQLCICFNSISFIIIRMMIMKGCVQWKRILSLGGM